MRLAQRVFSDDDQKRFASLSGDHNPLHLDTLQARRTPAGAPVVHGINLLLWALDSFRAAQPDLPLARSIRAQFGKFVYPHEFVDVILAKQRTDRAQLIIAVGGASRSKVTIDFGAPAEQCPCLAHSSLEPVPCSLSPMDLSLEQMAGRSGLLSIQMTPEAAAALFPAASHWLGARRVAALAASSCLVGMVCPGLHSIFSELSVSVCPECDPPGSLAFRVTETDERFRSVEQQISGGGLNGTVNCFARIPPVRQATMESFAGVIGQAEFAGSVALIVGGSRGLGEFAAKAIAAGGGRVIVTWQTGKDDAERVAREIRSAGGVCETLAYDVRRPASEQLASLGDVPTSAYYFATPPIFRPQAEVFSVERFRKFLEFYVNGFWQLTQALRSRQPKLSVFYPSTVFVAERPEGMTEYSMAKAAGEVLCAELNAFQWPLHVTVSRLPRLLTDQTASVTPMETASPMGALLPVIREVQSWPR